jgi:uncharacterized membrane protein YhdT
MTHIIGIVYMVVGVVMANNYGYLAGITGFNDLSTILSAVLAVVLWPLLLIGVNLHITF